mmetsp:Transcript_1968/g.6144  ORF Transcript_1968/g.6144 Transcript_1968/m.6144 type:complete len:311 (+) Transcript_1968:679-1611(+)
MGAEGPLDARVDVGHDDRLRPGEEGLEERPVGPGGGHRAGRAVELNPEGDLGPVPHQDGGVARLNPGAGPRIRQLPRAHVVHVHPQPPPRHRAAVLGAPQAAPQPHRQRGEGAGAADARDELPRVVLAAPEPAERVRGAPREGGVQEAEERNGPAQELRVDLRPRAAGAVRAGLAAPPGVEDRVAGQGRDRQPQGGALGVLKAPGARAPQLEEGAREEAQGRANTAGGGDAAVAWVEELRLGPLLALRPTAGGRRLLAPSRAGRPRRAVRAREARRRLRAYTPDAAQVPAQVLVDRATGILQGLPVGRGE